MTTQSKKPKTSIKWYNERHWAALLAVGLLLAAYGMGSRALFTGSIQQYFMTLGLLIVGANRLAHTIKLAFWSLRTGQKVHD